jgi:hypothetical protein
LIYDIYQGRLIEAAFFVRGPERQEGTFVVPFGIKHGFAKAFVSKTQPGFARAPGSAARQTMAIDSRPFPVGKTFAAAPPNPLS